MNLSFQAQAFCVSVFKLFQIIFSSFLKTKGSNVSLTGHFHFYDNDNDFVKNENNDNEEEDEEEKEKNSWLDNIHLHNVVESSLFDRSRNHFTTTASHHDHNNSNSHLIVVHGQHAGGAS